MKYASLIALSAALGLASPGLALAACQRPSAPAAIDGAGATRDQMLAAKAAVSEFMTASDTYQSCVLDDLQAQRKAAAASKTKLDPAAETSANGAVNESQADKERVGAAFNASIKAFLAAHPS